MNYLDIIILVPLTWGVYRGFTKGLIIEVASLAALILGVWCAIHFSEFTAEVLINNIGLNISANYLQPVSFAVTFIAVAIVIVLVSRLIDKFLSAVALGGINKIFGAAFGGAKVLLVMAIILYFFNGIDNKTNLLNDKKKEESMLYLPLVEMVQKWMPKLDLDEIKEKVPEPVRI